MSRYWVLNVWWIGILFLGSFLKPTHGEIACVILSVTHFFKFYLRISKWQSLTNLELNLNNCRLVLFLSHVLVCRAKAKPLLSFSFCDNFPCQSTWGNRSWRLQHTARLRKKKNLSAMDLQLFFPEVKIFRSSMNTKIFVMLVWSLYLDQYDL